MEAALGGGEAGGELVWLDPRAARTDAAARARAAKHPPPTDAVVFIVGGGNYIEYHNLIDFAKVIRCPTWECVQKIISDTFSLSTIVSYSVKGRQR